MAELEKLLCTDSKVESLKKINAIIDYKELDGKLTNCITEIPQRIKLELADGVLTLKAGSKVIVPNGVGVFDEVEVLNDLTLTQTHTGSLTVYVSRTASYISAFSGQNSSSNADIDTSGKVHYNTTTNKVTRINNAGNTEQLSFPIAIITMNASTVTSIDQIFNGMGYIGSTIWVDKGVKGLIPNGRNEDGTLRNIERTTPNIITRTLTNQSGDILVGSNLDNAIGLYFVTGFVQDEVNNINTNRQIIISKITASNGVISNFQPKLPFRAVDYNDLQQIESDLQTQINTKVTSSASVASNDMNLSAGVSIATGSTTSKSGYLVGIQANTNTFLDVYFDGIHVNRSYANNNKIGVTTLRVGKGVTVTFSGASSVVFYPCKGDN